MSRAILVHAVLFAGVMVPAIAQVPPYSYANDYLYSYDYGPPGDAYRPPSYNAYGPGWPYNAPASAPAYPQDRAAPPYSPQAAPNAPMLSPQDLGNLVAPIALYPDMLLSQVLAASTYPAEIMQAEQWMRANTGLRGQQLVEAAKEQNWDPSVQALVAFRDVMNLLTRNIQWTTALGNAFLSQQADLMDAIQRLRAAAHQNGTLTNTPQQSVTYEQQNGQNAIVIQPTDPQVLYPPVYDPNYVWGPPADGAYPSLDYEAPGYGIAYGVATFLGSLFSGLWSYGGWGWGLSWLSHGLFLNNLFFSHYGFHDPYGYGRGYGYDRGYGYAARSAWVHDPGHRLGVPYGSRYSGSRFAGGYGSGWNRFGSRNYAGNYSARSYDYGVRQSYNGGGFSRGASGYFQSGRQMDAYRALRQSAAQPGYGNFGSGYRGSGWAAPYAARNYGGASSGYRGGGWEAPYAARSYGAVSNGYRGGTWGGGRDWSMPSMNRSFSQPSRGSFSSHFSAPRSSGHFWSGGHFGGGGGHFGGSHFKGGGGHSGGGHSHGGGHSRGGGHKR